MKTFLLPPFPISGAPPLVLQPCFSSARCSSVSPSFTPHQRLLGSGHTIPVRSSLYHSPPRIGCALGLSEWCAAALYRKTSPTCLTLSPWHSSAASSEDALCVLPLQKRLHRYTSGGSRSSCRSCRSTNSCVGTSCAARERSALLRAAQCLAHNSRSCHPPRISTSNCSLSDNLSYHLPLLLRGVLLFSSCWNYTGGCAQSSAGGAKPILEQQLLRMFYGRARPTFFLTHPAATTPVVLKNLTGGVFPVCGRLSRLSTSSSFPVCMQSPGCLSTHVSSPPLVAKTQRCSFPPVPLADSLNADRTSSSVLTYQKRAPSVAKPPCCPISSPFFTHSSRGGLTASPCRGAVPSVSTVAVSVSPNGRTQPQLSTCLSRRLCTPQLSPVLLSAATATVRKGEEPCRCSGAYGRSFHPHHAAVHASFHSIDTNNDGYISKKEFFAWACCHVLPLLPQQLVESEASPFQQQYSPCCVPPVAGANPVPSHPEQLQQQQELHHMLPHHRRLLLQQKQQHLQQQQQRHPDEPRQQRLLQQQQSAQHQERQCQRQDERVGSEEASSVEQGETVAQCLIKVGAFARSWRRKKEKTVDASTTLLVATWASFPYVGFGFMDNCLMLLCGEMIDTHIGAALGVSTLAAAGLGNLLSCASGVVTGGCVERLAAKITRAVVFFFVPSVPLTALALPCGRPFAFAAVLPRVQLSSSQSNTKIISRARTAGALVGICCGCILGLFPLLFFGIKRKEAPASPCSCEGKDVPEQ